MTRGILGRFFDWTFGSLCADAERRRTEEARERANQERFERRRKEIQEAEKKVSETIEKRRKAEAERERAAERNQEEIKRVRAEQLRELQRRGDKILSKKDAVIDEIMNDPNRHLSDDPELRQLELEYDRVGAEIEAKYAQKLEIIKESGERKLQDLKEKYLDTFK